MVRTWVRIAECTTKNENSLINLITFYYEYNVNREPYLNDRAFLCNTVSRKGLTKT